MNLPQLEATHDRLAALEAMGEKLSGTCATLKGLVLLEVKHRLGHGKLKPWVAKHYEKSYRTAVDYMNLAREFTKDAKSKSAEPCTFAPMLQNVGETLDEIEALKLDLRHPTVRAVADWTEGRSAHQLLLQFHTRPQLGGDTRVPCPKCKKMVKGGSEKCPHCGETIGDAYDPNAASEVARDLLLIPLRTVAVRWSEQEDKAPLWTHLTHAEMAEIDGLLIDLRNQLKPALKKEGK
jgi:hypothetical protein